MPLLELPELADFIEEVGDQKDVVVRVAEVTQPMQNNVMVAYALLTAKKDNDIIKFVEPVAEWTAGNEAQEKKVEADKTKFFKELEEELSKKQVAFKRGIWSSA